MLVARVNMKKEAVVCYIVSKLALKYAKMGANRILKAESAR